MFLTKFVEKIKHISCSYAVYLMVWKNMVVPKRT